LPLGPNETGAQWYARCRLGVRSLACWVWGEGQGPGRWLTYLSRCQELTAKFSLTIVFDLFRRVKMDLATKVNLVFDCGPHFRSYEVVATVGTSLMEIHRQIIAVLYGLECHLKGRIDGYFAQLNAIKSQVSAEKKH
jgi:hypothetical protein